MMKKKEKTTSADPDCIEVFRNERLHLERLVATACKVSQTIRFTMVDDHTLTSRIAVRHEGHELLTIGVT